MYAADKKVKVLSSPYSMFEVGKEYTISYVDDRPYGIFLQDPFYEGEDVHEFGQWPFSRDELELVV